jgi:hypothetical protein
MTDQETTQAKECAPPSAVRKPRIVHFRNEFGTLVATAVLRKSGRNICIGFSYVSKKDSPNKKLGRIIAAGRMEAACDFSKLTRHSTALSVDCADCLCDVLFDNVWYGARRKIGRDHLAKFVDEITPKILKLLER